MEYFELEIPQPNYPRNLDLYKGEVNTQTGEFTGYALYFNHKAKLLLLGQIKSGGFFEGLGVAYDFSGD